MTLKQIYNLSNCTFGKHFLTKSYSLEILLFLYENKKADGIEELLSAIKSNKPKLPAFITFITYLENKGCIKKEQNNEKRSKRRITLTDECKDSVSKIIG